MATKIKTGQKAPVSGQYKPVGSKTEVTFVKGKTVPPTLKCSPFVRQCGIIEIYQNEV